MPLGTYLRPRQSQVFRLGQVANLLQMSAGELDEHLTEIARDNPMLLLRGRPAGGPSVTDVLEMTGVERPPSLYDHVFRELSGLLDQGGLLEKVLVALIAELEPSGWLGRAPEEIADNLNISTSLVETALRVVQKRIDPPGFFARNLAECLRLQLEDRDAVTSELTLVLNHISELESGGMSALVRATGLSTEAVQDCMSVLRRLEPKPGSAFSHDPTLCREPDVRITPSARGWDIEFLSCWQGRIDVATVPRGQRTEETAEAMAKARALKKAVDIRISALRQVVRELVDRQSAYFRQGESALVPLAMSDIADKVGFHLSTVSRVLNGLLIEGPNGIVLARALFPGTASLRAVQSKPQVQARIRDLLRGEDRASPITDRRLTELLQAEGIVVSRRVVSNYRRDIGILPPAKRRLRA